MTTLTAKIIADSISPEGKRLTSVQCRLPWIISPELLRHRVFSFSSASARAIPVERMIQDVLDDPFVPLHWGKNQPGMQAREECDEPLEYWDDLLGNYIPCSREEAWEALMYKAVEGAKRFSKAGYHKQIANRLLAPFSHVSILITATEWSNFFALRRHEDAEPHIRMLADRIWGVMGENKPIELKPDQWHLPYVSDEDRLNFEFTHGFMWDLACKVSAARCARLSYTLHDGKPSTIEADLTLANKLLASKHMSPFEHQANPDDTYNIIRRPWLYGNLVGWIQHRKLIPDESF